MLSKKQNEIVFTILQLCGEFVLQRLLTGSIFVLSFLLLVTRPSTCSVHQSQGLPKTDHISHPLLKPGITIW